MIAINEEVFKKAVNSILEAAKREGIYLAFDEFDVVYAKDTETESVILLSNGIIIRLDKSIGKLKFNVIEEHTHWL